MTPKRAASAIGEQVLIDEGTKFETEATIAWVDGATIACDDGEGIRFMHRSRVHFAPGRITDTDLRKFAEWYAAETGGAA